MSQAPSIAIAIAGSTGDSHVEAPASVSLKGTTRGLEILISGTPSAAALGARLTELLAEAPGFFAGSHARVAIDGVLPVGALACLEEVAARFELRIVELGPTAARRPRELAPVPLVAQALPPLPAIPPLPVAPAVPVGDDVPRPNLAEGTGPIADDAAAGTSARANRYAAAAPVETTSSAALVSAATALVNAAMALTSESAATALAPRVAGDATRAAEISNASEDAAGKAASAGVAAENAACKAALSPVERSDAARGAISNAPEGAACKVASAGGAAESAAGVWGNPNASEDAACKAASAGVAAENAACKAALSPDESSEAGGAALISNASEEAACKAASAGGASEEAACKTASSPDESSEAGGAALISNASEDAAGKAASPDPGLLAALAAVLVAAGGGDSAAAAGDAPAGPAGPRLVIGPVRSGRIVDHVGHLIVIGDVNPGAEVRAEGSIIVLGRLRGVAHAAIGRDAGCIIALSLQPQQLRIGRMVARAGDADRPGGGAEIAYATGETIVVERFLGRLPSGLAASM